MQIEELNSLVVLFDVYGKLLSKTQYQMLSEFLNFNLSETELAESLNVTRQSVHDAIAKAKKQLVEFEEKCQIVKAKVQTKKRLEKLLMVTKDNLNAKIIIDDIIDNL